LSCRAHVHARLARLHATKRPIWRALRTHDQDLFWHRRHWEEFEQMLDRYLGALDDRADPRIVKGLRDMHIWRQRNQELIGLVLDHPHWPRDIKLLEEHLAAVRGRLGERRRNFRTLPRLNSLLRLMLLDLRGQADENHRRAACATTTLPTRSAAAAATRGRKRHQAAIDAPVSQRARPR
jgi:hypothetical protein